MSRDKLTFSQTYNALMCCLCSYQGKVKDYNQLLWAETVYNHKDMPMIIWLQEGLTGTK
jgi:hypothetical protein